MKVKKHQLELDMEQQTGSKWEKEYVKAVYCHPAYLIYMQSTSRELLGWMKHKLESRLLGEISITSDMQITPPFFIFTYFSSSLFKVLVCIQSIRVYSKYCDTHKDCVDHNKLWNTL